MLSITPQALSVMQRVTDHPSLESTSGLRIACRDQPSEPLQVAAVHGPQPGDRVLERNGARLYLEPEAAGRVEGRRLDAVTDTAGRIHFVLKAAA
jgi:Fe-S cluster assembly iron-binding protein IscA